MKSASASLVVVAACLAVASLAHGQEYDLVINGGRVMNRRRCTTR